MRLFSSFLNSSEKRNKQLIQAIANGTDDDVRKWIDKGADVNCIAEGRNGEMTALMLASAVGSAGAVTCLLDSGADIDAQAHNDLTALHFAVTQHQADIVSLLLERGADQTIVDRFNKAPLIYATQLNNDRIVLLLTQKLPIEKAKKILGPWI